MTAPKWYDFTLMRERLQERGLNEIEKVAQMFENLGADRYVIGEEVGEGGLQHYQCRVVFKTEKDFDHLKVVFAGMGHVSPSGVRDFKYCEKEGKFYRSWEKVLNKFADAELRQWQRDAIELLNATADDRRVMVIVDPDGNHGKSFLTKVLVSRRICNYIPNMSDYKDLMRICMAKAGSGYVIDMERAQDPKKVNQMWRTIESIKNGYLFEDRYQFRELWIEPPKVLVFTNDYPPMDVLSADRWEIYTLFDDALNPGDCYLWRYNPEELLAYAYREKEYCESGDK